MKSDVTIFISGQGKWLNRCFFAWIILQLSCTFGKSIFFFFNFDYFLVFLESLLTNEYFTPNSNCWAENPLSLGIPGEDPGRIGLS